MTSQIRSWPIIACTVLVSALLPAAVWAQVPATAQVFEVVPDSGDTAWILAASVCVMLLAVPGIALLYGGSVRLKNMATIITQALAVTASVSLLWVVIGYSLAFGDGPIFIGTGMNFMLKDLGVVAEGTTIPESAFVLFQMAIAIFAAVLLIGSVSERARFGWMTLCTLIWSLIVYIPVSRAIWAAGWLADKGVVDFAGGIVVHVSVGVSALVIAIMVGRRAGFLTADRKGASPELALVGTGLIWAAWLGLSGGMALGASDDAASAIINTHIAACAAALIWAGLDRFRSGAISVTGVAMGAISGLVAVSAGATYIAPAWAIFTGLAGGAAAYFAASIVRNRFLVDDSLNIFAVHGVAGIVGSLLVGIFLSETFNGGGLASDTGIAAQLGIQAMGIILVAIWSIIGTLIAGYGTAMIIPMHAKDSDAKVEG